MNPILRWLLKRFCLWYIHVFNVLWNPVSRVFVCLCVLACAVITILTGQMLTLSVSLLCDWFTADKH